MSQESTTGYLHKGTLSFIVFIILISLALAVTYAEEGRKSTVEWDIDGVIERGDVRALGLIVKGLDSKVDKLTTRKILDKLKIVEDQIKKLSKRIDKLNELLPPETVTLVMNVQRMGEEIKARNEFENKVNTTIKNFEDRLDNATGRIDTLLILIATILLAAVGAAFYLGLQLVRSRKM